MLRLQKVIIHVISYYVAIYRFLSIYISYSKMLYNRCVNECNKTFVATVTHIFRLTPVTLSSCFKFEFFVKTYLNTDRC
jgi:hypothetical protein